MSCYFTGNFNFILHDALNMGGSFPVVHVVNFHQIGRHTGMHRQYGDNIPDMKPIEKITSVCLAAVGHHVNMCINTHYEVPPYPFSPLKAIPVIKYFWPKMYMISMGIVAMTPAAISR